MTRDDVIVTAIAGEITWIQAATICGVTARHMRRLKEHYEKYGYDGVVDGRRGKPRRKRIALATIEKLCELKKREKYADFSVRHFWEKATEEHGLVISYPWARLALQAAGLVEKSPGRGRYRRKPERRPMWGLILALDDAPMVGCSTRAVRSPCIICPRAFWPSIASDENRLATFATANLSSAPPRCIATAPARERKSPYTGSFRSLAGHQEQAESTNQNRLTGRTSLTANDPDLFKCQRETWIGDRQSVLSTTLAATGRLR